MNENMDDELFDAAQDELLHRVSDGFLEMVIDLGPDYKGSWDDLMTLWEEKNPGISPYAH